MAIILIEGFDTHTDTSVGIKYPVSTTFAPQVVTGRFSPGSAFNPGQNNQNGNLVLGFNSLTQCTIGAGLRIPVGNMAGGIQFFNIVRSDATVQFSVGCDSNGAIRVARSNALLTSAPMAVSANNVIAANTWFYCEVEFILSDTVGECRVYINGALVINIFGTDTKAQTGTTFERVVFTISGSGNGGISIDDIYLTDTPSRLGESRIFTLLPTSDDTAAWTRSAGTTNFGVVDELPFNTTDYVASSTVNQQDFYGFEDLPYTPAVIHAVQTSMFATKDDAASRTIRANLKIAATVYPGTDFGLTAGYLQKTDLFATNPNTSAAWTTAAVNALLAGPEVRL